MCPALLRFPYLVQELARKNNANAIIAVGVILKGQTDHARNLASSVTHALQQIALNQGVPIINVVLSLNSDRQARERCLEKKINRGTEAARTAVAVSESMSAVKAS